MHFPSWLTVLAALGFGVFIVWGLKDIARMWAELHRAARDEDVW